MSILKDFDKIYDYSHMWNWGLDWIIVKDIYIRFPDSYSVLTPFAYTYLEELIRSTTSEYGLPLLDREGKRNNLKVGIKLVNLAIEENKENVAYVNLLEKEKNTLNMTMTIHTKRMEETRFFTAIFIQGFGARNILKSLFTI